MPHGNVYVTNVMLVKLSNIVLEKRPAAHREHGLGHFVGERTKLNAFIRGQDNGLLHRGV